MPADYLEKCAAEGAGCDCVNVCKYDPSPPSPVVSNKSEKQAEFFRLAADMPQGADPILQPSPSDAERLRELERAVQFVARLIEDTVSPTHAGLHAWLKRPAVRAARGLE
jgi:hypothetical protein